MAQSCGAKGGYGFRAIANRARRRVLESDFGHIDGLPLEHAELGEGVRMSLWDRQLPYSVNRRNSTDT